MKITGLKTFVVNPGHRAFWGAGHGPNWTFVKIYTDEGIEGLGEAFQNGKDRSVEAAVKDFERWLIGKDPTRITHNWQALYHGARYPLGTASLSALSAIEQALWDITGKSCGLPVYQMLGGACRDHIRLYASTPSYLRGDSIDSLVEGSRAAVADGFTAVKFTPHPPDYPSRSARSLFDESLRRVQAVREAVGKDVEICLEHHGRSFDPVEAIQLAMAVEPFDVFFLEEPTPTDFPDSLIEVKNKTSIHIAAGERAVTRENMRALIEKRALHVIQPEPTANGGILETIKVASMADLYHISVAPHHAGSPVALAVCAQLDACVPNFLIQECNVRLDTPAAQDLFKSVPTIKDGSIQLSDRPGLGIELNEAAVGDYPYQPFDRRVVVMDDGSIGI